MTADCYRSTHQAYRESTAQNPTRVPCEAEHQLAAKISRLSAFIHEQSFKCSYDIGQKRIKGFESLRINGGTSHQFVKQSRASSLLEKADEKSTSEDLNPFLQARKCEIVERYSHFWVRRIASRKYPPARDFWRAI